MCNQGRYGAVGNKETRVLHNGIDHRSPVRYSITGPEVAEMRSTITVSIPEELREELDAAAERQGVSPSDLIRESLRKYLLLCEFQELRKEMVPHAARQGIFTDQDVFDRVS